MVISLFLISIIYFDMALFSVIFLSFFLLQMISELWSWYYQYILTFSPATLGWNEINTHQFHLYSSGNIQLPRNNLFSYIWHFSIGLFKLFWIRKMGWFNFHQLQSAVVSFVSSLIFAGHRQYCQFLFVINVCRSSSICSKSYFGHPLTRLLSQELRNSGSLIFILQVSNYFNICYIYI